MDFTLIGDRLIVQPIEDEAGVAAGIGLPDAKKGKVVALGEDLSGDRDPKRIKIDDEVLYPKGHGDHVQVDGEELLMLRKPDLIMVIPAAREPDPARATVQGLRKSFTEDIEQLRRLAR